MTTYLSSKFLTSLILALQIQGQLLDGLNWQIVEANPRCIQSKANFLIGTASSYWTSCENTSSYPERTLGLFYDTSRCVDPFTAWNKRLFYSPVYYGAIKRSLNTTVEAKPFLYNFPDNDDTYYAFPFDFDYKQHSKLIISLNQGLRDVVIPVQSSSSDKTDYLAINMRGQQGSDLAKHLGVKHAQEWGLSDVQSLEEQDVYKKRSLQIDVDCMVYYSTVKNIQDLSFDPKKCFSLILNHDLWKSFPEVKTQRCSFSEKDKQTGKWHCKLEHSMTKRDTKKDIDLAGCQYSTVFKEGRTSLYDDRWSLKLIEFAAKIGSNFIPIAGPLISAGITTALAKAEDLKLDYSEGENLFNLAKDLTALYNST